jgi:uracil-DNA glycosylase family 4
MIVGEAPGLEEAVSGKPFVGSSGKKLDKMLRKHNIDPQQHVYITNAVLMRPPGNRDPTWEELMAYRPFLERHIEIVRPKLILCLGRISATLLRTNFYAPESLMGPTLGNSTAHRLKLEQMGDMYAHSAQLSTLIMPRERFVCQVYSAYHPAALLRNDSNTVAGAKMKARWVADFEAVAKTLLEPALEFIDAAELLEGSCEPGFRYNTAEQLFCARTTPTSPSPGEPLEMEIHSIDYQRQSNSFNIYGRTFTGASVNLQVHSPQFKFYVGHPSVKKNELTQSALETIVEQLNAELCEYARERLHIAEEKLHEYSAQVRIVQKRNYIRYHANCTQYLKIHYGVDAIKSELQRQLSELLPDCKFFEATIKPEQQLEFKRKLYIRGWLRVDADSTLSRIEPPQSTCDLEYTVNFRDLQGFSPNPGDGEDVRWQRTAPLRVLAFDAEMLNQGGRFPRAEQDPVVSICAYGMTYNRQDRPLLLERVRNPTSPTELKLTGRVDYDDAVAFAVGSVAEIPSKAFKLSALPNVPAPPIEYVVRFENGLENGAYRGKYTLAIRYWNVWIDQVTQWRLAVGRRRAHRLLVRPELALAVEALRERPDGSKPDKVWPEAEARQWEQHCGTVRKLWHHRNTQDIAELPDEPEWSVEFATLPEELRAVEFGEIQARWSLFHCKKRIFCFETEHEMLRGFYAYVKQYDPDIVTGYNTANFDLPYLLRRVEVLRLHNDTGTLISLGRFHNRADRDQIKISSSRATGTRIFHTVSVQGRDCYDFMNYVMRDHKLQSYTLSSVAQRFLGDNKNDVPYSAIPSLYRNNRERLNDYCLKDAELVLMLMNYLNNMNFLTALARLVGTIPIGRLYVDGKQSQVFSCLRRFLSKEGLGKIIPDANPFNLEEVEGEDTVSYEGAHVFQPKTLGLYHQLLLCLDFASLYPNIIISRNLGHDAAGILEHMLKQGVNIKDCFKTPRRFPVPNMDAAMLEECSAELSALLVQALQSYRASTEPTLYWGEIVCTENQRHLVCPLVCPRSQHDQLEEQLKKHTETSVKIVQNEENGKKNGTFRIVLDIGRFYYFLQPRKLTREQLQQLCIEESACRKLPGSAEFYVPQFGDRKRRTRAQLVVYLQERGLDRDAVQLVLAAAHGTQPQPEQNCVRYFPSTPDLYSPKIDESSLVGTEQEMLAARRLVKREMETYKPDSEMYKKLDSQQLALKVLCNSLYGATGVKVGRLAGMHISATVTAEGKRSILRVSEGVRECFDGDTQGGDTDSIFVHIPSIPTLDKIYEPIDLIDEHTGELKSTTRIDDILDYANSLVEKPNKLEFEKAYTTMNAVAKKRAAVVEHVPGWDPVLQQMVFSGKGKLSFKGLETKRRDSCVVAQQVITGFLTRLMDESVRPADAVQSAVNFTREQVIKIMNGNVPFHQMVQARQLSKSNYNSRLPHVELCEKKRRRNEPVPELGSRIPFVVVTGNKGRKFYDSVEDPDYALQHNLQLDYAYVVEKKIAAPIKRFSQHFPDPQHADEQMFGNLKVHQTRNLRDDDPIFNYAVRLKPCMGCGLSGHEWLCEQCAQVTDWKSLWNSELEQLGEVQSELNSAMQTCRACMAIAETEDVVCGNLTCKEYFPRKGKEFELIRKKQKLTELQQQAPIKLEWEDT